MRFPTFELFNNLRHICISIQYYSVIIYVYSVIVSINHNLYFETIEGFVIGEYCDNIYTKNTSKHTGITPILCHIHIVRLTSRVCIPDMYRQHAIVLKHDRYMTNIAHTELTQCHAIVAKKL